MFSIEFEQMIQINFVILLFSTIFVNEAESQVDTSIALLWTTADSLLYSVIGIWYGDPESYAPILAQNQSSAQNYSTFTIRDSNYLPTYHAVNVDVLSNQIFISDYVYGCVFAFPDSVNPIPSSISYRSISSALPVSTRITSLATDWLSRNLYWTDMTNKQIGLTSLENTRYWRPVVNTKLASVQHLVIHANLSLIFWCDVGSTPKIERSDLLGNNRTVLVNSTKVRLTYPTKVGLDFLYERLCWLDSQATLFGCTDYEGSVVKTFTLAILQSTSSFVIYKRYVYFGSGTASSITIAEMQSSQQLKIITTKSISLTSGGLLSRVIDMTMFSSYSQQGTSPCMVDNGGCSHICVATSQSTVDCQCSAGYFLDPDGTSCVTQVLSENFLLMSDTLQRTIYQVELSTGEIHAVGYFASASPASFDYDPTEQTIYWVDASTITSVWRTSLGDQTRTLLYSTFSSITSLVVDVYYGRKIYLASSGSGRIQEMNLDGTLSRSILSNASTTPSALVFDFYNRLLYFSECTTGTIQTIDLDNISNRNILQSGLLYCVKSMAIDFAVQLMYFGDSSGKILMSDFSGSNRRAIYLLSSATFYGLAIDSNYVYIADNNGQYLTKINRTSTVSTPMTSVVFVQPYSVIIPSLPGPNRTSTTTTQTTTTTTTTTTTSTTTSTTTTTPTTTTAPTTTTTTPTTTTTTTILPPPITTTTTTTTAPSTTTTTQIPSTPTESTNLKSSAQSSSASAADSSTVTIIVVVVVVGGIIIIAVIVTVGVIVYKKRRTGAATNQFEDHPKPENPYDNIVFDTSPYYTQLVDCSSTDPVFEKPEKGDVADDDEGVKFEEIGDGIYL